MLATLGSEINIWSHQLWTEWLDYKEENLETFSQGVPRIIYLEGSSVTG